MSSRFILPFADVGSGIKPSSGAKLFFFKLDGVTPKDTFIDQLSVPTVNENPVIADSNGVFGDIYIDGSYSVTLQDNNGSQIFAGAKVDSLSNEAISTLTTTDLINSTTKFNSDAVILTSGFTASGGVGAGSWVQTGVTGLAPSQPPVLDNGLLTDGNGDQWRLTGNRLNVLSIGAPTGGVSDALDYFSAAGNSGFKNIDVSGGQFLLSAVPTTSGGVTWNIDRGVSFTGTGRIEINAGKDKIVSKGDYRSLESDPSFHSGIFGYLEQNSALTAYGNLGLHGSAYTSWREPGEAGADIGVSGFAAQDQIGNLRGAWAFYGTAVRESGVNAAAFGMELDVANMGDTRPIYPHNMFNSGQTQTLWLGSGGEITEVPEVVGVATCAIGIISNDPAGNATFDKGIVFGATALEGSDGLSGNSIAIAMAPHQSISYYNAVNGRVGDIRCITQNTLNAQRLEFTDFGVEVKGLNDGRSQFRVNRVANADSYVAITPSTGTDAPEVLAVSLNANSNLKLTPKGTGKIQIGYNSQAATVPGNFVANRILEIIDSAGASIYIPSSTTTW